MRVTEIKHEDRGWSPLVLHPRLSVITGDAEELTELADLLANLYSSAGSVVGGGIEYSGFHMPLDQTAVVSLDLHGRGMRSLDAALLEQTRTGMRTDLMAEVQSRLAEVESTIRVRDGEVDALHRKRAASEAATVAVAEELRAGNSLLESLVAQHELALEGPRELNKAIDDARGERVRAESALGRAEQLAPTVLGALDPDGAGMAALRLGTEAPDLVDTVARAEAVGLLEAPLAEFLTTWLHEVAAGTAEPSLSISAMLEEIERMEREWEELSARGVEGDQEVLEARERHEEVTVRAANLEELASSGLLAQRARSEIDAAHEAADDLEEHRVLQSYGFDSYLDYTIALSTRSVGEAIEATVERVRVELVRATDELEAAREQAAAVRSELNERRDALRERVIAATGSDPGSLSPEVLATIAEVPAELQEVPGAVQSALEALRSELAQAAASESELHARSEELVDPQVIEAELDEQRRRIAALEPLLGQAQEVHETTAQALEQLESELDVLQQERAELVAERAVLETSGAEPSATEVAVVIRAATEQIVVLDGEPTPVMLEDTFRSSGSTAAEILEALVASVAGVQLVYLTQHETVLSWAKKLPTESGSLVRLGRRRWLGRRLARSRARNGDLSARTV